MKYVLEKLVDGQWYTWGNFDTPETATKAAFELGRNASVVEDVRLRTEVKPIPEPELDGQMSIGGV